MATAQPLGPQCLEGDTVPFCAIALRPSLQMRKLTFGNSAGKPGSEIVSGTATGEPTTVPRDWGGQARVKAEAGQVGSVQAMLTHWAP